MTSLPLIFSTRLDGTDVPVYYSGVQSDKPYVGVKELLNILGHSMSHADEFPRSETKLWQELVPGNPQFPPNKLFTTEVGFAVYYGKTKLHNWAKFKKMFDTIEFNILNRNLCNSTNPLCMIPPGHNSGCGPCPPPNNNCDGLAQILQALQNQNATLQAILAGVQELLNGGGGGGGTCDLTEVLADLQSLLTQVGQIASDLAAIAGQLTAIGADVTSLSASVQTLIGDVNALVTTVNNLTTTVNTINANVETILNQLEGVDSNLATLLSQIAGLIQTINSLVSSVANIDTNLLSLTATVNANSQALAALTADVQLILSILQPLDGVNKKAAAPESLIGEIYTSLNDLGSEVKRLNDFNNGFNKLLQNVVDK
ncbi:p10-2 [Spodoptera litura granulovirus]|uniref:P10-2 n=1 Tax=Spodoptera litura granulovirus TaxID=359919 RepID=A5IZM1_9BBAC|nr:p10-2 [Spodoptera litura granulovirus]ABQ51962.1 p10-2 [Spodoptera litura granulovirus]